jgi:hypothetical protein
MEIFKENVSVNILVLGMLKNRADVRSIFEFWLLQVHGTGADIQMTMSRIVGGYKGGRKYKCLLLPYVG